MCDQDFTSPADLDKALGDSIAAGLEEDIAQYGSAHLVVSGGSTPKGLFAYLAACELPWENVTVLLADERWVSADHADSNEAMLRSTLLTGQAASAKLLSLSEGYPEVGANLARAEQALASLPTFSYVVLGMGGDMHTASLFPCCAEIEQGMRTDADVLMTHPTTAPHARISLSRKRLANTRRGAIHIVGADKHDTIVTARSIADPVVAPISAFLAPPTKFSVWYAPKT